MSNFDMAELNRISQTRRIINERMAYKDRQIHSSVQFKPITNRISIIHTWPLPSTSLSESEHELVESVKELQIGTKQRQLSSIFYAPIDNTSELGSIESECEFTDASDDVYDETDGENSQFDQRWRIDELINARKRTDSNTENFVLIIDRLDEKSSSAAAELKAHHDSVQHPQADDVILSVLNISLPRDLNAKKGFI